MDKKQYWSERALTYHKLNWVRDAYSMDLLIETGKFTKTDVVLDMGTGLGTVAMALSPLVDKVIGTDCSRDMLARAERADNVFYVEWDMQTPLFAPQTFDKVTVRQMLHHIPKDGVQGAVGLCNEVLKHGGKLIIVEPVCPSVEIEQEYAHIFKLKDGRNILTREGIANLMIEAGFGRIRATGFTMRGFSVRNWLDNNALNLELQNEIFDLHVNASPWFKSAFNLRIVNGDCLIDTQNVIVTGIKP